MDFNKPPAFDLVSRESEARNPIAADPLHALTGDLEALESFSASEARNTIVEPLHGPTTIGFCFQNDPRLPVKVSNPQRVTSDCALTINSFGIFALPELRSGIAHERHGEDDIDNGLRLHP